LIWGYRKLGNPTRKHTKFKMKNIHFMPNPCSRGFFVRLGTFRYIVWEWLYMCKQHTVVLFSLCKCNCQKWLFWCWTMRSTRGQNMAVRSTQGRSIATRSKQGGVTLVKMDCCTCIIFIRCRIPDQVYCNKSQKNNNFIHVTMLCTFYVFTGLNNMLK